jgi:photosystem II stability/assembly factor-like uncharacterized protein
MIAMLLLLMPVPAGAGNDLNVDLDQVRDDFKRTLTFRDKFYDAAAIGKQVWIVGYFGTIVHVDTETSRAERQSSGTTLPLFDVSFVDQNQGYVIGKRGIILKTTDGGKTWVRVKREDDANLFAAHFIDADTGWAVGDFGTIVHTSDGGATWENLSLQDADINLNGCHFIDAQNGFIVGEFESIYRTRDGGMTWQEVNEQKTDGVSLFGVRFKSDLNGLAVGQNGVLFCTVDGGSSWERRKLGTDDNLLGIGVIEGRYNIVGLRGMIVEESPDGELTINNESRISDWLNCIVGFPSGAAIAAGDHGRILWSGGSRSRRQWKILN